MPLSEPLPAELLRQIASPSGGHVALVLGAGCSVEPPTNMPLARECSEEIHRKLVADGIIEAGECKNPQDLSAVADTVYGNLGSQREVVKRLLDTYKFKRARPNEGYLIAAALLCEGGVSSIVTLNFDLALSQALIELDAPDEIRVIEGPEHLDQLGSRNVYYLHCNANAASEEAWVLRTSVLEREWRDHWQPIIANRALSTPVVLFAGLSSPAAVLTQSIELIRRALEPYPRSVFLAGPGERDKSAFFQELRIDQANYIRAKWCELMSALSERLVQEHVQRLRNAATARVREDKLHEENIELSLSAFGRMGLIGGGKVRAEWLLHKGTYRPLDAQAVELLADLLLAIAAIARLAQADAVILEDGRVEFRRLNRTVVSCIIASGRGLLKRPSIESEVEVRRARYTPRSNTVLVGGTVAFWETATSPPESIIDGEMSREDILRGSTVVSYFHVDLLRNNATAVGRLIP
jgi:hypothetical protein